MVNKKNRWICKLTWLEKKNLLLLFVLNLSVKRKVCLFKPGALNKYLLVIDLFLIRNKDKFLLIKERENDERSFSHNTKSD